MKYISFEAALIILGVACLALLVRFNESPLDRATQAAHHDLETVGTCVQLRAEDNGEINYRYC